ncbi:MAG: TonB-dependent receptor [Proteobacteria bacterium]|nr:TonB-dependent receptor [Pseudomonadota bacterium]
MFGSGRELKVAVAEGEVVVDLPGGGNARISQGQRLVVAGRPAIAEYASIAAEDVAGWRAGRLVFRNEPLSLVAGQIGPHAGVTVAVNPAIANRRFQACWQSEMVRSLLPDSAKSWASRLSRGVLLCICLPWTVGGSTAVAADAAQFSFDIPATTLDEALTRFTEQTGVSVGKAGALPRVESPRVAGRFTAQQALRRLLSGSGLVAVPLGSGSFRLEPRTREDSVDSASRGIAQLPDLDEVLVTATKRRQDFAQVPLSMTVVSGDDIDGGLIAGGSRGAQHDVATSSTHLGPGRERQFIRGIADSPFLGPSQATVSVQFDDARVTWDAPDPDLLLLDVEQVEILKGPQGPLYGTGALGGVFRIVPRRPDLEEASWQSTFGASGLRRSGVLPEPHDSDFLLGVATAQGRWLGYNALVTASIVSHESDGRLDASAAADLWGESAPLRFLDQRRYRLLNQEARLWSDAGAPVSWLLGASYLAARSDLAGVLEPEAAVAREVVRVSQRAGEAALFGEATVLLGRRWRATGGMRVFRSQIQNRIRVEDTEEVEETEEGQEGEENKASYSVTPSVSVDWRDADQRRFFYLRYARAVRPGGLNLDSSENSRFVADRLSNVDLGARVLLWGDAVSVDSAVFVTRWSHIQSDYLLENGLVGTRNVGAGRILGAEGSLRWVVDDAWRGSGADAAARTACMNRMWWPMPRTAICPWCPRSGRAWRCCASCHWADGGCSCART